MDSTVCPGCGLRVEPIRTFERSPKTGKVWTIVKCPRERCGFNIDIEEEYTRPPKPPVDKKKSDPGDGGRSFWRYGI